MKKTKKIVALFLAAVMLVCTTVAATVAYLTSTTGPVNNTFTVGKVEIDLKETDVDEYGTEVTPNPTVTENEYKLVPGHKYMKDPTIIVKDGSEKCWLFAKIENGLGTDATITMASGWTLVEGKTNIYAYETAKTAGEKVVVFTDFTFAGTANPETYKASAIKITAYAVQADGFATAAAAWAAAPTWN